LLFFLKGFESPWGYFNTWPDKAYLAKKIHQ